jgi:hypothetical protein
MEAGMGTGKTVFPESLDATLIAPCGMNCGLCMGHLREKKRCGGCNGDDARMPRYCMTCRIRNCDEIKASAGAFCFECSRFPCVRLRQLDKRYRAKYGMSMLVNLASIREFGLERFVAAERERWRCPECGGVVCVHKERCLYCGHVRSGMKAEGGRGA